MTRQSCLMIVLAVLLTLTLTSPLAAQDEGVARVRIGYFAFDPRENETYMDGERVSFDPSWAFTVWAEQEDILWWNTATPYFDIPSGVHSFAFVPSGDSLDAAILKAGALEFTTGHTYALAVVGHPELDDLKLLMVDETEAFAGIDPAANYRGIFIHNVAGAPPVQVTVNDELVVENLSYGEMATFSRPAGVEHTIYAIAGDEPMVLFDFFDQSEQYNCELMAMTGTYPGDVGSDIMWAFNFGSPDVAVVDGGAVFLGDTLKGEVPAVTQRTVYHLRLENDSSVNISIHPQGVKTDDSLIWWAMNLDPMVYLYDSSGNLLFWNDDAETWNSDAGFEALPLKAGEYTIEVGGFADLMGGGFELKVESAE